MTPVKTAEQIRKKLTQIAKQHRNGSEVLQNEEAWTKKVLKDIGILGREHFYVCTNKEHFPEAKHREWLFDQCWLRYKDKDPENPLLGISLLLQCKWEKEFQTMKDDFEKLLVTKASLKVLVFQQSSKSDAKQSIAQVKNWVSLLDPDFVLGPYLLCCYVDHDKEKDFKFHTIGDLEISLMDKVLKYVKDLFKAGKSGVGFGLVVTLVVVLLYSLTGSVSDWEMGFSLSIGGIVTIGSIIYQLLSSSKPDG